MEKRTALALSGTAHAGVIVWALLAGLFNPAQEEESLQIASVGIVSTADFDALVSRTPGPGAPTPEAPSAPEAPTTPDAPVAETPPPQPAERPETPAPTPPDTTPDVAQVVTPPTTEAVTETPNAPPPPAAEDAPVSTRPTPRQADIVTQRPTPAPPPLVETAPTVEAPSEPTEEPAPQEEPVEPQEQAAPEETTTAVVTEADEPAAAEVTSLAPEDSPRPGRRPDRPAPIQTAAASTDARDPAPAPEPTRTAPANEPRQVDTTDALREALAGGGSAAQEGAQLTDGQKEGFRLAVQACWDLGTVSTDVLRTIVEVRFQMREDGFPVSSSIRLESARGGTDASAQIALERARQAIIGCSRQNGGYDLPTESYDDWKDIIITFDPTRR